MPKCKIIWYLNDSYSGWGLKIFWKCKCPPIVVLLKFWPTCHYTAHKLIFRWISVRNPLLYTSIFIQQNKHCNGWSRAPNQIQMYPDRDTTAQLLPAHRIQQTWSVHEITWSSARAHNSLFTIVNKEVVPSWFVCFCHLIEST